MRRTTHSSSAHPVFPFISLLLDSVLQMNVSTSPVKHLIYAVRYMVSNLPFHAMSQLSIPDPTFYMQKCTRMVGKGVHARGTCWKRNGLVSPQRISPRWMASKSRGRTNSRTMSSFGVRGSGKACYQAHALYRPNILKIKPFAVC